MSMVDSSMDFLRVSRPLLIEDETEPTYPYFKVGTAFLLRFRNQLYAVTADHCVGSYHADQIRVPTVDASRGFLSFNKKWKPTEAQSQDHQDFWLLRVDAATTPGYAHIGALEVDESSVARARGRYRPGSMLVISGYPGAAENIIDYERQVIRTQRVVSRTAYVESGPFTHCHLVKDYDRLVTEYGGYSGSPVLAPNGEGADLAGIVVRANNTQSTLLFIDIASPWSALLKTVE